MRAAEILRRVADLVAAIEQPESQGTAAPALIPVPNDVFLPPLQGKYEMLKKAVGIDNTYDENMGNVSDDPEASNHKVTPMAPDEQDALDRMKRAAGISTFINTELSDDEPLDS